MRAMSQPRVPMYRGNAAQTGEMPWPVGLPVPRWRFRAGDVLSRPLAAAGRVWVGCEGVLHALDTATGVAVLRIEAGGGLRMHALAGDLIFAGAADGHLYA